MSDTRKLGLSKRRREVTELNIAPFVDLCESQLQAFNPMFEEAQAFFRFHHYTTIYEKSDTRYIRLSRHNKYRVVLSPRKQHDAALVLIFVCYHIAQAYRIDIDYIIDPNKHIERLVSLAAPGKSFPLVDQLSAGVQTSKLVRNGFLDDVIHFVFTETIFSVQEDFVSVCLSSDPNCSFYNTQMMWLAAFGDRALFNGEFNWDLNPSLSEKEVLRLLVCLKYQNSCECVSGKTKEHDRTEKITADTPKGKQMLAEQLLFLRQGFFSVMQEHLLFLTTLNTEE